ncbi:hypothetical protein [Thalassospira marina]|nr:hypothetical protein [Thalassospira marina]
MITPTLVLLAVFVAIESRFSVEADAETHGADPPISKTAYHRRPKVSVW